MTDVPVSRSYHKVIALALVALNLAAVVYAIFDADPGQRHYHFREGSFVSWLFAAQMMGASLLFAACFFAGNIIPMENVRRRDTYGWLVFAAGFLLLALDQQFALREQLTVAITGSTTGEVPPTAHGLVKVLAVLVAVALVVYFRAIVLGNFRMVLAFVAGFWFLLLMLIIDMLFESVGVPWQAAVIMEGTAKLLAMAMFVSAPFVALLDRLQEARAAAHLAGRQRRPSLSLRELQVREEAEQAAAEAAEAAEAEAKQAAAEQAGVQEAERAAEQAEAEAQQQAEQAAQQAESEAKQAAPRSEAEQAESEAEQAAPQAEPAAPQAGQAGEGAEEQPAGVGKDKTSS